MMLICLQSLAMKYKLSCPESSFTVWLMNSLRMHYTGWCAVVVRGLGIVNVFVGVQSISFILSASISIVCILLGDCLFFFPAE